MSKLASEEADKTIEALQTTIYKISTAPQTLGSKWQISMLDYYYKRLAEYLLRLDGITDISAELLENTAAGLEAELSKEWK